MFNSVVYWIGAKGCSAIGAVGEMITSESACSHNQTWNMGLVLLGAGVLLAGYFLFRRRR